MKNSILFFIFLLSFSSVFAQKKYWIEFTDKNIENYDYKNHLSDQAIQNRIKFNIPLSQYTDVPVNKAYVDSLRTLDVQAVVKSKWLNSISATLTPNELEKIQKISFIDTIYGIDPNIKITSADVDVKPEYLASAMKQMNVAAFNKENITGKGVTVGVIDAGFYKAASDRYMLHLQKEGRVKGQRDFINKERKDLINESATDADYHGAMVLKMICGYDEKDNIQAGMAVNADFYLARTENGSREYRGEEDNWIQAMEWMDSLGVRLVNTSLGYAINMDDPSENYKKEEMDGKTARITRAAQIASTEKGMFLVVSAGNEGGNPRWGIISAPADAEGVLSVGATKEHIWERIGYSSIGPGFLDYIKPNVSCYSPNGTSFSAPAVAGFVACLMEKAPDLNNKQLKEIIEKSAHLYPYGNNFIGYGVPQADRALLLIENQSCTFKSATEKKVSSDEYLVKGKVKHLKDALVFHKKNRHMVVSQETLKVNKKSVKQKKNTSENEVVFEFEAEEDGIDTTKMTDKEVQRHLRKKERIDNRRKKVAIKRPEGVERSTLIFNNKVVEILWE